MLNKEKVSSYSVVLLQLQLWLAPGDQLLDSSLTFSFGKEKEGWGLVSGSVYFWDLSTTSLLSGANKVYYYIQLSLHLTC